MFAQRQLGELGHRRTRIVVLGGGFAGATTAFELERLLVQWWLGKMKQFATSIVPHVPQNKTHCGRVLR